MLQKTLTFDNDVLDILKGMEWSQDGLSGKLTCGQLQRDMYLKVNKALESMGGKWDRKSQSHLFKTDPRPQVEGLLDTGTLTVEKDGFFETPLPVVERMLELVPLPAAGAVLEPSAGLGAIARVLKERGPNLTLVLVEKNTDRCEAISNEFPAVINTDFLTYSWLPFDRVYMNPPFEEKQDIKHVLHAYNLLTPGGCLISVMSEGTFFRTDSITTEFKEWANSVNAHNEKLPDNSFMVSGTGVNTRLFWVTK